METAIILFKYKDISADLEIPLDISVSQLIQALNGMFKLGINPKDTKEWFLKSEDPIALLKGEKLLEEYGIRTGTILIYET